MGGGNGPVAGRASPPRPSPLHPLPRPSSLLQRRQPRHEVRTRPRRARAKAPTVAAVVVVDGRRLLSRRAPRSTSPSSRTCRERLRVGRCRLDLHFRRGVGRGGRLRRLGGDRGLDGGSDRLGGLAPLAPLRIPRHARLPAHRAELCTVPEGGGGGKAFHRAGAGVAPREEAASIVSGAGNATPRSWEVHKEAKTEQNGGHLPEQSSPTKFIFTLSHIPP